MRVLVKLIYWVFLPALSVYAFLIVSPQQIGSDVAQRTINGRIFLGFFLALFFVGTGNALIGAWKNVAKYWISLGVYDYQNQSLFTRISVVPATIMMLVTIAFIVSNAISEYLPAWNNYRPLIVGFILVFEAVGSIKYALDILNTGNLSS